MKTILSILILSCSLLASDPIKDTSLKGLTLNEINRAVLDDLVTTTPGEVFPLLVGDGCPDCWPQLLLYDGDVSNGGTQEKVFEAGSPDSHSKPWGNIQVSIRTPDESETGECLPLLFGSICFPSFEGCTGYPKVTFNLNPGVSISIDGETYTNQVTFLMHGHTICGTTDEFSISVFSVSDGDGVIDEISFIFACRACEDPFPIH